MRQTVCTCHVEYAFQSESTLYSCLNVKELLALSSLARSLSVLLRTKWFWVRVQLQSLMQLTPSIAIIQVPTSVAVMLMILSATFMLVDLFVSIMQLEVSVAFMQVKVSAANMRVTIFIETMQVGASVAIMQVALSTVHYAHDYFFYCNYDDDRFCCSYICDSFK